MNVAVRYTPSLWVKDGSDFYCEHPEIEVDTVMRFATDYITGDSEDYEAVVYVCSDCREVIEK